MTPEEIRAAAERLVLQVVDEVDPSTATLENGYLIVSGRAVMPLDGVSWSFDRSDDLPISDELGSVFGTLCLLTGKPSQSIATMTRWQYTAYLADCDTGAVGGETHQFVRDYAVIDSSDLERYLRRYMSGSALWGGFHHGTSSAGHNGRRRDVRARPNTVTPTSYHRNSFMLVAQAPGPREQYLRIYHTIELLFDYITFRKLVKTGDDLVGFGKVMAGHQRAELDRLKSIIKEFCRDTHAIASKMLELLPFLNRAEQMFQTHAKDGNPLNGEDKWTRYCALVASGSVDHDGARRNSLAGTPKAFDDLIASLAAYQIYRIRSSIVHSRIGEFLLTEEDDDFIASFGIALIEEVALQIFSSQGLADLVR